jgi:hypothetical protein
LAYLTKPLLPSADSKSFNINILIVDKSGAKVRQLQKVINKDDGNDKNDETFPLQLVSSESPLLTLYPLTALLTFICPQLFGFHHGCLGHSKPAVRCTRKPVSDAFQELGPYYIPRPGPTAWMLSHFGLFIGCSTHTLVGKSSHLHPPRRRIATVPRMASSHPRLAAALHYFAGGSPYDIAGVFGLCV